MASSRKGPEPVGGRRVEGVAIYPVYRRAEHRKEADPERGPGHATPRK